MKVCLNGKIKFQIEVEEAKRGRVVLRVDGVRHVLRKGQVADVDGDVFFDNGVTPGGDCK